jgi:hypothetical protein
MMANDNISKNPKYQFKDYIKELLGIDYEVVLDEALEVLNETSNETSLEDNTVVVEETTTEEVVEEITDDESLEFVECDDNASGVISRARFNYSFESKLILSDYQTKLYYEKIITFAKSYAIKVTRSWKKERIYLGRKPYAMLFFRGKKLCVALALDPKEYEDSKYVFEDISNKKAYQKTPFMMKLTSDRKLKHTLYLLELVFKNSGLVNQNLNVNFKKIPYRTRYALYKDGLIKANEEAVNLLLKDKEKTNIKNKNEKSSNESNTKNE